MPESGPASLETFLSYPMGCFMWRFLILSVALAALIGCGSKKDPGGTVKGTITYKGSAVNGAGLMMYPQSGNSFVIPVTQEGTFDAVDIPAGEYVIVVQPSSGKSGVPSTKGMDPAKAAEMQSKIEAMKSPPTIPIPQKYTQQKTSDLKLTVAKGDQTVSLELKD